MSFISDALRQSISHIGYHVSCALKATYPERAVLEGQVQSFNPADFAEAGHCALAPSAQAQEQVLTYWTGEGLTGNPENAVYDVTWAGESLEVVLITFSPRERNVFLDRRAHSRRRRSLLRGGLPLVHGDSQRDSRLCRRTFLQRRGALPRNTHRIARQDCFGRRIER